MSYQGWKNYETWNIFLWLDNEEPTYNLVREWADDAYEDADDEDEAVGTLAARIKEHHEKNKPELDGAYGDLLQSALDEVDWHEIAKHYVDDCWEEDDDEEADE